MGHTADVDIAELVLRYVRALAWPLAVVVIVVLFRHTIRATVSRLTELSGAGVSAKFQSEAESMAVRAVAAAGRPPEIGYPPLPAFPPPYVPAQPPPEYRPPAEAPPQTGPPGPDADVTGAQRPDPAPEPPAVPPPSTDPWSQPQPAADHAEPPLPPFGQPFPLEYTARALVQSRFAAARTLVESQPDSAVRLAWAEVERAIGEMAYGGSAQSPAERVAALGVAGEVPELVRELDRMRGDAAARPDAVTPAAGRAYVTAAEEVTYALYRATGRIPA